MKTLEKIDQQFSELLWKMPKHWFSEVNAGVRVMSPITFALYQAFCMTYEYEFGIFESDETNSYVNKKGEFIINQYEEDCKKLLPIYEREKQQFFELSAFLNFIVQFK